MDGRRGSVFVGCRQELDAVIGDRISLSYISTGLWYRGPVVLFVYGDKDASARRYARRALIRVSETVR